MTSEVSDDVICPEMRHQLRLTNPAGANISGVSQLGMEPYRCQLLVLGRREEAGVPRLRREMRSRCVLTGCGEHHKAWLPAADRGRAACPEVPLNSSPASLRWRSHFICLKDSTLHCRAVLSIPTSSVLSPVCQYLPE